MSAQGDKVLAGNRLVCRKVFYQGGCVQVPRRFSLAAWYFLLVLTSRGCVSGILLAGHLLGQGAYLGIFIQVSNSTVFTWAQVL